MAKKKNYAKENIFLKQRLRELEVKIAQLSPSSSQPVSSDDPAEKPLKEKKGYSTERKQDTIYLNQDLQRSLLITAFILSILLVLWRWGNRVFDFLPI